MACGTENFNSYLLHLNLLTDPGVVMAIAFVSTEYKNKLSKLKRKIHLLIPLSNVYSVPTACQAVCLVYRFQK